MKRFGVFAGQDYYPLGGWADFKASFDTAEEARDYIDYTYQAWDWYEIVDLTTGTICD